MTLEELLPDADYRFNFRFERADPAEFFGPTPEHEQLVAQRRHCLETAPGRHVALLPEGLSLLEEAIELARCWRAHHRSPRWAGREQGFNAFGRQSVEASRRLVELAVEWEPDFLFLTFGPANVARLAGGAVCFPSSWSLEEKVGHPVSWIHGLVPGLNDALGAQIDGFLARLKPGTSWLRANWGLSRSAELNQHPARGLPRLDGQVRANEVWLRAEHQVLLRLPKTNGVLFGIRISNYSLSDIQKDKVLATRLSRALRTMPESVAAYKGLASARERLAELLS